MTTPAIGHPIPTRHPSAASTAVLRAHGVASWIDSAGDRWVWSAFATRYVRTPAGVRRYGLPIGSPIVARSRVPAARDGEAPRVRRVATQRGAERYGVPIGDPIPVGHRIPNRNVPPPARPDRANDSAAPTADSPRSGLDGLAARYRRNAIAALGNDDLLATEREYRLNPDSNRATASLLNYEVRRRDLTPLPETLPEQPPPAPPLPRVDEDRVQTRAAAVRALGEAALADAGPLASLREGPERARIRDNMRDRLRADYPNASDTAVNDATHSALDDLMRGMQTDIPGDPGRGTRGAVRALEREEAFRADGRNLSDYVDAARIEVRDGFPRAELDEAGVPDADTLRRLNAVRDAGAAITATVDARTAARRTELDQARTDYNTRSADAGDRASAVSRDLREAWRAEFGEELPLSQLRDFRNDAHGYRGDTPEQAAVLDRFRDRQHAAVEDGQRLRRDRQGLAVAEEEFAADQAQARLDVLAGLRPMGPGQDRGASVAYGLGTDGGRARIEAAMAVAQRSFPTAWLTEHRVATDGVQVTNTGGRGFYRANPFGRHQLELGDSAGAMDTAALERVAIHELGHGMEATNRGLRYAQQAFLRDRITRSGGGVDPVSTIRGSEVGWRDDFRNHYTGRVYTQDHRGVGPGEVWTTGAETLFGRGGSGNSYTDRDMEHFLLGAAALL